MATPSGFRARAADCEWAATNAQDRLTRASLLQTARLWRQLADEEEAARRLLIVSSRPKSSRKLSPFERARLRSSKPTSR
jgi:hypothetical protein